jgi:hypothetical protein
MRFRSGLKDEDLLIDGRDDTISMCQFLKARKWDVDKALIMWKEMLNWRRTLAEKPLDPPISETEHQSVRFHLLRRLLYH